MTRVLSISADRSGRGILVPGSAAYLRQKAYAEKIGTLDIIGFSLQTDPYAERRDGALRVHPTRSITKFLYGLNAVFMAAKMPWPDVVSVQDPFETGLTGLIISRFVQKPLHVQVHTDFLAPEYARHSFLNRLRVWMAGIVLRRATRVRVVSERIRISIQTHYRLDVPVSVLPIFVDIEKIRQTQPDESLVRAFSRFDNILLFVGRLESEKNPRLAIDAFAQAAPERSCLVIVGDGSQRTELVERVKELGLDAGERMVIFEGQEESRKFYPHPDLVLVTSRYEGYGLVIIEAFAAGKPVLSTDVGIAREAGAIVTSESHYADALKEWFAGGPREASLSGYPYANFEEYVAAYCADIEACIMSV